MSESNQFPQSVFGYEWDTDQYQKPWRDIEFLTNIYESERAPTYEEIASKLQCSSQTVGRYMPDDAQRGGPGLPYEDIAMLSGGYDSLVATHYSMEELDCDVVLHIDTQTGIEENRQYVKKVCDIFDWPLEIITPNKELSEFAKEYGFPKAPAHSWIYRYLKEHPLSSFAFSLECDTPSFYTGVRKQESTRRMENVSSETQEMWGGRWLWEAPIADFSDEDVVEYIVENGLPRSPVVETIARSGECFCGAYADRYSELLTLKENYPQHYQWLEEVEKEVQEEIGTEEDHCYWGTSGMSSDELQELMDDSENESDLKMCVDCEGEGHRDLGHDQDPTYETIYLAGPRCDGEDPYSWHKWVQKYDTTTEWINPFAQNSYSTEKEARENSKSVYDMDLAYVRQSDAVLLRRISGYNLCGASIEAAIAMEDAGIPVVVYNDSDGDVPLMLEALATEVTDNKLEAVQRVSSLARQHLRDVEDEQVMVH